MFAPAPPSPSGHHEGVRPQMSPPHVPSQQPSDDESDQHRIPLPLQSPFWPEDCPPDSQTEGGERRSRAQTIGRGRLQLVSKIRNTLESLELSTAQEWLTTRLRDTAPPPSDQDLELIESLLTHILEAGSARCVLPAPIAKCNWSPHGSLLAVSCLNGMVFLFEWHSRARLLSLREAHHAFKREPITQLEWSEDGWFIRCMTPTGAGLVVTLSEGRASVPPTGWCPSSTRSADGLYTVEIDDHALRIVTTT